MESHKILKSRITCCGFHSNSQSLIISTHSGEIASICPKTFAIRTSLADAPSPITGLDVYHNSIYVSGVRKSVFKYDISPNGEEIRAEESIVTYNNSADGVAMSPKGEYLLTFGDRTTLNLISIRQDYKKYTVGNTTHRIKFAQFDPSGKFAGVMTADGTLHIVDIAARAIQKSVSVTTPCSDDSGSDGDGEMHTSFSWVPYNQTSPVLAFPGYRSIGFLDASSKWSLHPSSLPPSPSRSPFYLCQFSPNGRYVAGVTSAAELCIYEVPQTLHSSLEPTLGTLLHTFPIPQKQYGSIVSVMWGSQDMPHILLSTTSGAICSFPVLEGVDLAEDNEQPPTQVGTSSGQSNNDSDMDEQNVVIRTPVKASGSQRKRAGSDAEPTQGDDYRPPSTRKSTPSKRVVPQMTEDESDSEDDLLVKRRHSLTKKKTASPSVQSSKPPPKLATPQVRESYGNNHDDWSHEGAEESSQFSSSHQHHSVIPPDQLAQVKEQILDELDDRAIDIFQTIATRRHQQPFMPTSTPPPASGTSAAHLLCVKDFGSLTAIHNLDGSVTLSLIINANRNKERFTIPSPIPVHSATFTRNGLASCGVVKDNPKTPPVSVIQYHSIDAITNQTGFTWSISLPPQETAQVIAMSKDIIAVATSLNFLRIFSLAGIELSLISLPGPVVTMTARDNILAIFYHSNSYALPGEQNIMVRVMNTEIQQLLTVQPVPLTPKSTLTWAYVSSTGILYTSDSHGVIRGALSHTQWDWHVLSFAQQFVRDREYHVWPIAVEYITSPQYQSHCLTFYECYKQSYPVTAVNPPPLQFHKLEIPFLCLSTSEREKKHENLEGAIRERLLWDEIKLSKGIAAPSELLRKFDAPFIVLTVENAKEGLHLAALNAASHIRDLEVLRKLIEKLHNTLDNRTLIRLLQELLQSKLAAQATQKRPPTPMSTPQVDRSQHRSTYDVKTPNPDNPFQSLASTPAGSSKSGQQVRARPAPPSVDKDAIPVEGNHVKRQRLEHPAIQSPPQPDNTKQSSENPFAKKAQ